MLSCGSRLDGLRFWEYALFYGKSLLLKIEFHVDKAGFDNILLLITNK